MLAYRSGDLIRYRFNFVYIHMLISKLIKLFHRFFQPLFGDLGLNDRLGTDPFPNHKVPEVWERGMAYHDRV
jgi:hypothetical protein